MQRFEKPHASELTIVALRALGVLGQKGAGSLFHHLTSSCVSRAHLSSSAFPALFGSIPSFPTLVYPTISGPAEPVSRRAGSFGHTPCCIDTDQSHSSPNPFNAYPKP